MQAQDALKIFEKEIPVYTLDDLAAFKADGIIYSDVPLNDKLLGYEITLPQGWRESKSFGYSLNPNIFVEVGRYTGPVKFNEAHSYVTIQAIDLDHQTTAREWFLANIWKSGYSLQGVKEHGDNRLEALHVQLDKGETYTVRTLVIINGGRLIQVSYYLPASSWKVERALQNTVLDSFKLLHPDTSLSIKTEIFKFLDVMSFKFPENWYLQTSEEKSIDLMQARLFNYDKLRVDGYRQIVNGLIDVKMFSQFMAESLEQEMTRHMDKLVDEGLIVQEFLEGDEDILVHPNFKDVRIQVHDVLDSKYPNRKTELWLVGMTAGDYYYVTSLITPARDDSFDLWTQNTRAYKLILGSFKHNLENSISYAE